MNISEIFYSIQGEGKWTGIPSVFVRTSGCNLRCSWCDTPYTSWKPEKNLIKIEDIIEKVESFDKTNHVVITGGEPMIQKNIGELINSLKEKKKTLTIETNGTVFRPLNVDLWSISPKLSNSTPKGKWSKIHEQKRINYSSLNKIINFAVKEKKDYQLKFVVEDEKDILEIEKVIKNLEHEIKKENIILMPQVRKLADIQKRYKKIVNLSKNTGYRFGSRLHIEIWGDKRGI